MYSKLYIIHIIVFPLNLSVIRFNKNKFSIPFVRSRKIFTRYYLILLSLFYIFFSNKFKKKKSFKEFKKKEAIDLRLRFLALSGQIMRGKRH